MEIELNLNFIELNLNLIELKLNFIELKLNFSIEYCYNWLAIHTSPLLLLVFYPKEGRILSTKCESKFVVIVLE